MRVKTSVTLPEDLLENIDQLDHNRSAFLERAARLHVAYILKARRDASDVAIIHENAERLNSEAEDVLAYQWLPE